jgi:20S proteasome alpha/beta subunit
MSLLLCLLGTDGLVLASDSRGTFGDPRGVTAQNDLIQKLYLANERVGILVAGAGDLGSTVVSGFLALPDTPSLGITELTTALHRYAREQFGLWFERFAINPAGGDSRPARPDLNFIVAGFESNLREAKIYRLSSSLDFAPMLHNYGFGIDGVAQYGLYLLNRLYDPQAVTENLQYLAAYVITETASQDGKVGGAVQIAIIGTGGTQLLSSDSIEGILAANRERSRVLKRSFLKNEYTVGAATHLTAEPASDLKFPVQKAHAPPSPVVVPTLETVGTMDAVSTVVGESSEECSSGLAW